MVIDLSYMASWIAIKNGRLHDPVRFFLWCSVTYVQLSNAASGSLSNNTWPFCMDSTWTSIQLPGLVVVRWIPGFLLKLQHTGTEVRHLRLIFHCSWVSMCASFLFFVYTRHIPTGVSDSCRWFNTQPLWCFSSFVHAGTTAFAHMQARNRRVCISLQGHVP